MVTLSLCKLELITIASGEKPILPVKLASGRMKLKLMAKLTFLTEDTEKMSPSQSSEVDEQPVDQNTVKISNRSLDYPLTHTPLSPIDINIFF